MKFYKEDNKNDMRILVWMILPLFFFFMLMLFILSIFQEPIKESLKCDSLGCTYQNFNIFDKNISSHSFKKADIYNMRIRAERGKSLTTHYSYDVYIVKKGLIYIKSPESYNYIKSYREGSQTNIEYNSTSYKGLLDSLFLLLFAFFLLIGGWVVLKYKLYNNKQIS